MQKDPHSEHAAVNSKVSLRLPILLNPRISDRYPTVAPDMQQIKGQPEHLGLPKKRGIAPNLWPSNAWENHLHEKENEFLHHQILGRLIESDPSVWMELAKEMDAFTIRGRHLHT